MLRKLLIVIVAVIAAGVVAAVSGAVPFDREDRVVTFNSDVYVQGEHGLLENPDDLTPADAPLYNVAGTGQRHQTGMTRASSSRG